MPRYQNAGIGLDLLQITDAKVVPGIGVVRRNFCCSEIRGNGQASFSSPSVGLTEAEVSLNIAGLRKGRTLKIRNRLFKALQPNVVEAEKQIWNEQRRLESNRLLERFSSLLVFAGLVVHQAEVGFQLGDFGMKSSGLLVELRGRLKVTPGLGLLRRGQE